MKNRIAFVLLCFISITLNAQVQKESHEIMKIADGFYHLFYDSSTAKSTIVEFDKFVVLLEVPIRNEGGGATNLKDHIYGGRKVIAAIEKHFPKKPLKYVLHSHWHPHSISSVKPFLEKGATLISTRTNFDRIRGFIDSATVMRYKKQLRFVEGDSLVIKDRTNSIVAYRFLQSEYKSTPATEYLYFYFPKYMTLHSGCMYAKWTGEPVDGRELITDRQRDLNQFINDRHLKVENFIRLNGDKNIPRCLMSGTEFERTIATGLTSSQINDIYFSMSTLDLNQKQDSIAQLVVVKKIPLSILNTNVYSSLRSRDFERALAFARLQVLVNPSDANAWDTLGEVNFFIGRIEMASRYHKQSLKVDPTFTAGGLTTWERSLKEYEASWANANK